MITADLDFYLSRSAGSSELVLLSALVSDLPMVLALLSELGVGVGLAGGF